MFLAYVTWIGGGNKWNFWNWMGTTAHGWQGGAQEIIRTQRNVEEQQFQREFFVGKADFRNSISCSDCGMRGRDCDADHVTLRLHHHEPQLWHCYTVLHTTLPNCDTLSGQITSRRSLWIFLSMWRFWLTRCITFSMRKVKIREQVAGLFYFFRWTWYKVGQYQTSLLMFLPIWRPLLTLHAAWLRNCQDRLLIA